MDTPNAPLPSEEEIRHDLQTNPRYAAFFADRDAQWVQDFARDYARQKWNTLRDGDFATRQLADRLTWFEEEAYERLWDIQQKKLFDLLSRWRAGQLRVPGLRTTYDFWLESDHIETSKVVPPITPEEVELYAVFLAQVDDYAEDVRRSTQWLVPHWQDYEAFREHEETWNQPNPQGEEMPAWYTFHNNRTGNGILLTLPDVRGPIEMRWRLAYYDIQTREHEAKNAARAAAGEPAPVYVPRYYAFGHERDALVREFARQFETPAFQRRLQASLQVKAERSDDQEDGLNDTLDFLREITRDDDPLAPSVPMIAHPNWREGLRLTADRARRDRVLAALPDAYEAYCQRETLGIAHPRREVRHTVAKSFNAMLREGREALGEAEDA